MSEVSRRDVLRTAVGAIGAAVGAALVVPAVRAAGAAAQLSNDDIIRALKDERFRHSLTNEQRAQLPAHPSGTIDTTVGNANQRPVTHHRDCYTCKFNCCVYSCYVGH